MNGPENPLVSVIVVCHNDGKWLPRCLESLRAQTIFDRVEIIIADNASQDQSDMLAQNLIADWPNATFLATGGDFGFCLAANKAAAISRGKYVQVLNPDTWLEPDFLEQFYQTLEQTNAAAAGPVVLNYEDNSLQAEGCPGFDFTGNYMPPRKGRPPEPLFCLAGFFFIRRELFVRLGMLDEKCFMYGEEMDLSWRIWIAGERIVPSRQARIHHRGAAGVNPAGGTKVVENRTSVQKRFLANRNRLLFIAKNCQHLLLLMLLPCAAVILLEGLVTLAMTRDWQLSKATSLDAIRNLWHLRPHVREQRQRIKTFRRHGDFWMLRFFRFGYGRWDEIVSIFKAGFPRFK
jgi:GT2 family glycosyltransferase